MKNTRTLRSSMAMLATVLVLGMPLSAIADAPEDAETQTTPDFEAQLQEAWLKGKLETALLLNKHLNSFAIDSKLTGNTAVLTGTVESGIDKDLAGEVALSINGIDKVMNRLHVVPVKEKTAADAQRNAIKQRVNDVTITAAVKTRLVANPHIDGLAVNVETKNAVVTLSGEVKTSEEKQLAELIARNTSDVVYVHNGLKLVN